MALTRISIDEKVKDILENDMKQRSIYQWAVYVIDQKAGKIVVESTEDLIFPFEEAASLSDKEVKDKQRTIWQKLVASLPDKEPRYAVVQHVMKPVNGVYIPRFEFLYWNPEGVYIRDMMLYTAEVENMKKKLRVGHALELTSKDASAIDGMIGKIKSIF